MNKVLDFLKEHKYLMVITVMIGISIVLSVTYSSFIVTSNDHKAAEMYIGELKYSIEIDGQSINNISVPSGETIIDVKVNNLNPVDTYYKLVYLKNSNVTIKYYSSTKNTNDVVTTYSKPIDSITSSATNNIKLLIINNSDTSQGIGLTTQGGYITNTTSDIVTPTTYTEITTEEATSSNTYFCKTDDTLTQGLKYVNGQYTYAYMQEITHLVSGENWDNISSDGWGVQLTNSDSTDDVTSKLCTYINDKPIVSMSYMFDSSKSQNIDLSSFDTSNVTNMSSMFVSSQVTTLDLSNFNTSRVTKMGAMFAGIQAATIDVSNLDTSNVTDMHGMFSGESIKEIKGLEILNTSKVTNMNEMFFDSGVTTIDLSNFDTSNVEYMLRMFSYSKIITLDLSSFDTSKVQRMDKMFWEMSNLKTIYVSNKFTTANVTSSTAMFSNSTNLVGGAGTTYDSTKKDKTYARIDGGTSNPGYFTEKPADPSSFSTDTWATIVYAARMNKLSKYNLGDTKTIDLGATYGTHTVRLSNTTTPTECSTEGYSQSACGLVFEFADIITTHAMNATSTSVGGWPATTMKTFLNEDIYNYLPEDLRNGIIDTTTVSGHGSTSGEENFTSTDKLYLLAPGEIYTNWTSTYDSAKNLTRTLDYYTNAGVTTSSATAAKKLSGTTATAWWTRSANSNYNGRFFYTATTGKSSSSTATGARGVSPAFRIG